VAQALLSWVRGGRPRAATGTPRAARAELTFRRLLRAQQPVRRRRIPVSLTGSFALSFIHCTLPLSSAGGESKGH
jgi:hypothetical protein